MSEPFLNKNSREYVSSNDAAKLYRVTNDYISRLCRNGKLRGILDGRKWLVEKQSLEAFFTKKTPAQSFEQSHPVASTMQVYHVQAESFAKEVPVVPVVTPKVVAVVEPLQVVQKPRVPVTNLMPQVRPVVSISRASNTNYRKLATSAVAVVLFLAVFSTGAFAMSRVSNKQGVVAGAWSGFLSAIGGIHDAFFGGYATTATPAPVAPPVATPVAPVVQPLAIAPTIVATTTQLQTIIQQKTYPITERTVERVITQTGLSADAIDAKIKTANAALAQQLTAQFNSIPAPYSSGGFTNNLALAQRIDVLNGTTLNNVKVNGITGLTAADIPTLSYMPLVGTPTYGQLLVGNNSGGFDLVSTSSLGISGGGGGVVATGGTGSTTLSGILVGNGTNPINTLVIGSGLTFDGTTLATAGSGITSIGPLGQLQNGGAQTLATSTSGSDFTITASGNVITFNFPNSSLTSRGLLAPTDFATFNSKLATTSLSAVYPLIYNNSTGVFTSAFSTTSTNIYSALQVFNGGIVATNATTTNATTTSFAITGVTSSLLKTLSNGAVVAAISGTDYAPAGNYATFGYPFPGNATTTQLAFNGGATFVGATSTALAVTGSTTISSVLSVGGALNANGGIFGNLTGNASTATALQTGRTINGVTFDGTANINIATASSTLLANSNTFSGSNTFLSLITGSISGNAGTATVLQNARNINGVSFNGSSDITVAAASSTLLTDVNNFSGLSTFNGGIVATNAVLTNATTTSFAISNVSSSLLKTLSNGAVVAAIAGTDYAPAGNYATFAYPFTNDATTTQLTFNGGAISSYSTTTNDLYVGGNLSLGGPSSGKALTITSNTPGGGLVSYQNTAVNGYTSFDLLDENGNLALSYGHGNSGTGGFANTNYVNSNNSNPISFMMNNGEVFRIASTSNIGIGTSSPFQKLSVTGNVFITGGATTSAFAISGISSSVLKTLSNGAVVAAVPGVDFALPGGAAASSTLLSDTNTFSGLNVFNASLGIGTTSPYTALSVVGTTTSSGGFNVDGNRNLLSYFGSTTISILGTRNFFAGLGANGSTTKNTGADNVFVGNYAGFAVTGSANVYIGSNSGNGSSTGAANTANNNTAVGSDTLRYNSSGNFMSAFGVSALTSNTTGGGNGAFGAGALANNKTGSNNNAFGSSALGSGSSGNSNSAFGDAAMFGNTSGSFNSAFGASALINVTTGTNNTALGYSAGVSINTGYSNVMIGDVSNFGGAAGNITSGFGNIGLGSSVYFASPTANQQLNIGNILFGTLPATTTKFQLPTSGSIGIGSSSPFAKFAIATNNGDTAQVLFAIGSSTASATSTLFSISNTGSIQTTLGSGFIGSSNGVLYSFASSSLTAASSTLLADFNTFSGNNIFTGNATFGAATTSTFAITGTTNTLLKTLASGAVVGAVAGVDYQAAGNYSTFTFPFTATTFGATNANATSTLIGFTGGIYSTASSTFTSNLGVAGTTTSSGGFNVDANKNLLSYLGSTTISVVGSDSFFAGLGANGSTTKSNPFNSTFVGSQAGYYANPNSNTFIGSLAGVGSSTGGASANTGSANTGVGTQALNANGTGSNNAAFGYTALAKNTSGGQNSAFGFQVLANNTTGTNNNAFGQGSMQSNTTGSNNVGFGNNTLNAITSGTGNVAIGYLAGRNVTTGYGNVLIGETTFNNTLTTGGGNISIGPNTYFPSQTANSQLNIGNLLYGSLPATTTSFALPTSGSLGVGTSSPFAKFAIQTNNGDTATTLFAIGSSTASATTTLFSIDNTGLISLMGTTTLAIDTTKRTTIFGAGANGSTTLVRGNDGVFIGNNAGFAVTGIQNTFIGSFSGAGSTTGAEMSGGSNTAVGYKSLTNNSTGNNNSAFGVSALNLNTTGAANSAFGNLSLLSNTTGGSNSSFGASTLLSNTTGNRNSTLGAFALISNTTGSANSAFGFQAGRSITTGYSNTLVGDISTTNSTITTGFGNIGLGSNIFFPSATANQQLNIGNILFGTLPATSTSFALPTTGSIGVGTSSPFAKFAIQSNNGDTATTLFAVGSTTASTNSTLFSISNTGSTTLYQLNSSLLKTDASGAIVAATAGVDYQAVGNYATFGYLFPNNATSTQLAFNGGATFSNATTTGGAYFGSSVAVGSTSPFAKFAIQTNNGDTATTLFAIGSSTASATTTLFQVNNVGEVGIGAASVSGKALTVVGSTTGGLVQFQNQGYSGWSSFDILDYAGTTAFSYGHGNPGTPATWANINYMNSNNSNPLSFQINNTDALRIDSNRNVGIGTTSPYTVLSVVGTTTSTGGFNVDGNTNLLSYLGSTTISISGTRNFFAGLGANGSTTKTTGADNVAIGYYAGYGNTSTFSTYIGSFSGFGSSTGVANSGSANTALGYNTLKNNTTGGSNIAIGWNALGNNSSGSSNQAVGVSALQANTTGGSNNAMGNSALVTNKTGSSNNAFGNTALGLNATGNGNSAFGDSALQSANSYNNSAFGFMAGRSVTTGYSNTLIGDSIAAVTTITTGFGNIGLGSNIFFPSATANQQLNIGNILFGTLPATSTSFALPTTGSIGVGTSTPFAKFAIQTNNGDTATTLFAIGSSTANSTSTLFSISNTGSTTAANGFNITSGCYAVNGNCLTTGGSSASSTLLADSNTFSALTLFTNGILALASSTIGNGTQAGGLTINGGATTTGTLVINGSSSLGLSFSNGLTSGFSMPNGDQRLNVVMNGTAKYQFTDATSRGGLKLASDIPLTWQGSTVVNTGGPDLGIARNAAGVLEVNNATFGQLATLVAGSIGLGTTTPFAQFSLLATSTTGVGSPTTLFAIASTTGGTATTTLFSISNTGTINTNLNAATSTLFTFSGQSFMVASSSLRSLGVGTGALSSLSTSGSNVDNTAFGNGALANLINGSSNTAIGSQAMFNATNTSAVNNTAVGRLAMRGDPNMGLTGLQNVGVGSSVMLSLTTGSQNVALGYSALPFASTGSRNTAIGTWAGTTGGQSTTGSDNVFVGFQSGVNLEGGYANIFVGSQTFGAQIVNGFGNIGIGNNTRFTGDVSNQLNIGGILFGSLPATTTAFQLPTSGSIGVGSTSPFAKFAIQTNNGDTATTLFAIGSSTANSTTTLFSISNTGTTTLGLFGACGTSKALQTDASGTIICGAITGGTSASSTLLADTNTFSGVNVFTANVGIGTTSPYRVLSVVGTTTSTGGFNVDGNANLLSYFGSTTISVAGNRNFFAGMGANGSTTKSIAAINDNVFIGNQAGFAVSSGFNVFIGAQSGQGSTTGAPLTGSSNTAVGYQTLQFNSSGSNNAAFGLQVLQDNTTGSRNSGFGGQSGGGGVLQNNTIGNNNSAFGAEAMFNNTSGNDNNAFGFDSLFGNTTGSNNSAFGRGALFANTTGSNNSAFGHFAGSTVTTGYSNLLLGDVTTGGAAAGNISTGFGNIGLGASVYFASSTANSQLSIGNLLFGTLPATSTAFRLPTSGSFGVGTSSPFAKFSIQTNNGDTATTLFAIGSSTANSTTTLFSISNTGSTTAANGFNITSGCYAINGNCLTTGGSSASSTLLTDTNTFSGVNVFNANVGIGTSSPYRALSVFGTTTSTGGFNVDGNANLLSYLGTTTISVLGVNNFFAGLGANGSSTKATGNSNVFIGTNAGYGSTNSFNVFVGAFSGTGSTTGPAYSASQNTALGFGTLRNIETNGSNNTAIGYNVLSSNTSGSENVAVGGRNSTTPPTLGDNTTGFLNSAFGIGALAHNTTGSNNVAMGYLSLINNTTGVYNTAYGTAAGYSVTTGVGNTLIGSNTAFFPNSTITSGSGNIGLGSNVFFQDPTASNQLNIGNILFGTVPATSTAFRLPTAGSLGVGTTSPFAKFSIQTNNGDTATTLFAIGSSTASATTTLFSISNTGTINTNLNAATSTLFTLAGRSFLVASTSLSTTKGGNTGLGIDTLSNITSGFNNTAVGNQNLSANTTGANNSAFGYRVLAGNTTGSGNSAFGGYDGASAPLGISSTGSNNSAFGVGTLASVSTGNNNSAFGYEVGRSVTTGYSNLFLGDNPAGGALTITTGGGNIGIGSNIYFASTTANQQLNFGNILFGTLPATSTSFALPTSGSIGIGTSSPFAKFTIQTNNGDTATTLFAIGSSTASATSTLFSVDNTGAASTTRLFGAGLFTCQGGNVLTWNNGMFGCATDQTAAGAANPFAWVQNFGVVTAATSTPIFAQNGIFASSTSQIAGASIFGTLNFATTSTTTLATLNGQSFITGTTNAANNVSVGLNTLTKITTGNQNAAFGNGALRNETEGGFNSAVGNTALGSHVSGVGNTGLGYASLTLLVSGSNNTSSGFNSGADLTSGSGVVAYGASALRGVTAATSTVAVGNAAGWGSTRTDFGSTYLGGGSGASLSGTSLFNTFIGYQSGANVTSGYGNLLIGVDTGFTSILSTGSNNIGIGNDIQFANGAADYQLNIGGLLFGTLPATSTSFALPTTGSIGVGTSSPFAKFAIQSNNGDTATTLFAIGSSTASATTTLFSISNTGVLRLTGSGVGPATPSFAVDLDGTILATQTSGSTLSFDANGVAANTTDGFWDFHVGSNDLSYGSSYSPRLFLDGGSGNLGVGTTTEYSKFALSLSSVDLNPNGEVNPIAFLIASSTASATTTLFSISNTGSTTAANGINITAGCYAINGNCLTTGGSSASSTLLTDTNTFSGNNTFTTNLTVNGTGTSTFAGNIALGASAIFARNNSFAGGNTGGFTVPIAATGNGSMAFGYTGLTSTGLTATGNGALAFGNANTSGGNIVASGSGSIALGQGGVQATNAGSIALGNGLVNTGGSIQSTGLGSFAAGYSSLNNVIASGNGSFAFGDNVVSSGTNSFSFGTGFANNTPSTFMVGFQALTGIGTPSGTPTLVVTATSTGISTTSPFAKFAIHAVTGDNLRTLFAIGSSTASATTTLFTVSNTGDAAASGVVSGTNVRGSSTSAASPALSFAGSTGSGFWFGGSSNSNGMHMTLAGNSRAALLGNLSTFGIASSFSLGFLNQATTDGSTAEVADVQLRRLSAGVLELDTATTGQLATLVAGSIGLGTTTPFAQFSLLATSTTGVGSPTTLFAIASTTAGTATSTLFSISNAGNAFISGSVAIGVATSSTAALLSVMPAIFPMPANTPAFLLGTSSLANPGSGGTYFGINAPSAFNGSGNAGKFIEFQKGGTTQFWVTAVGNTYTAGSMSAASYGPTASGQTLNLQGNGSSWSGGNAAITVNGSIGQNSTSMTGTSQDILIFNNSGNGWGPNSGNSTFNDVEMQGINYNQSGTANGISRLLYLNPTTITRAADFRVLETSAYNFNVTAPTTTLQGALFNQFSISSTSAVAITNAYGVQLMGAPKASTNVTITNEATLYIAGGAVNSGGTVTNATGLIVNAPTGATNNYAAQFLGGNVGFGSTSPFAKVSIAANNGDTLTTLFAIGSSTLSATTTLFSVSNTGSLTVSGSSTLSSLLNVGGNALFNANVGIGTTSPFGLFSINAQNGQSNLNILTIASSTAATTTTFMTLSNTGVLSLGASTNGVPTGIFSVDTQSGTTTIANLSIGNMSFDTNAGLVQLSDIPVDSGAAAGVQQAQVISIGGNPVFTVSGIADGSGNVNNQGVGIGTTSPWAALSVAMSSSTASFVVNAAGSSSPALFVASANSNGFVGIGTSTNSYATSSLLSVGNSSIAAGNTIALFASAGGAAYISNTAISFTSDQRLKKNITQIGKQALNGVLALQAVTYNFTTESDTTQLHTGFLAQQVQPIFPDLVTTNGQGMLAFNYGGLTPYLASAIQAQQEEIINIASSTATFPQMRIENGKVTIGTGATSTIAINAGTINYLNAATSTIAVGTNVWTIATSTATGTMAIFAISAPASSTPSVSINGNLYLNGQDITGVASTTATTSVEAIVSGPFASATDGLKGAINSALSALQNIASIGVRNLGAAVYATVGTFNQIFTTTLTATDVNADTATLKKLCLEDVCITKTQLQNLLNGNPPPANAGGNGGGSNNGGSTTTPPTIIINGANPATINVNDTYNDLGASATDVEGHDLTVHTYVDGAVLEPVIIDTSLAATHTIDYVATDTWGNTATGTRTLIIQ